MANKRLHYSVEAGGSLSTQSVRLSMSYPGGGEAPGQPQLDEQAKGALGQYAQNLVGLPVEKEERKLSAEETEKRDRARRANRIYKRVCSEKGLEPCFFNNFGTWSDYVKGRISESEFHEQAESMAMRMKSES